MFGSPWQQPGRSSSHGLSLSFPARWWPWWPWWLGGSPAWCLATATGANHAVLPWVRHRSRMGAGRWGPNWLTKGVSTSARRDPGSAPAHVSFKPHQLHLHHLLSRSIPRMVQGIPRTQGAFPDPMWHPQDPRSIPRPLVASPGSTWHPQDPRSVSMTIGMRCQDGAGMVPIPSAGSHGVHLAPAPPFPTWQHPGKPPGLLPSSSSPRFLLSSA